SSLPAALPPPDSIIQGSLHESALSVRHLGRNMNGLRAGIFAPPLMAAARVAAGVTSLTCQEPTFTGPLPNRRSRPFPALQDRSYEWVAPTRKRPPAESASSATFLIRPNMVSSPPYRAVALADNRPPELGQEVQMLVVQWAKQQKVREGRPEPRR